MSALRLRPRASHALGHCSTPELLSLPEQRFEHSVQPKFQPLHLQPPSQTRTVQPPGDKLLILKEGKLHQFGAERGCLWNVIRFMEAHGSGAAIAGSWWLSERDTWTSPVIPVILSCSARRLPLVRSLGFAPPEPNKHLFYICQPAPFTWQS